MGLNDHEFDDFFISSNTKYCIISTFLDFRNLHEQLPAKQKNQVHRFSGLSFDNGTDFGWNLPVGTAKIGRREGITRLCQSLENSLKCAFV
jgi:hypothetical protein